MNLIKTHDLLANCQKGVFQEGIRVLSWNSQGLHKGENQSTKREYLLATSTATTTTTTTITSTTSSIVTTTITKSI